MKSVFYILLFISLLSCNKDYENKPSSAIDYKQEMRDFVIGISQYSKSYDSNFIIIPQNGIELVTNNGESNGTLNNPYLNAIDGNGQEDLFYGYDDDDQLTPSDVTTSLVSFLDKSKNSGNVILVTDYCSTLSKMKDSYSENNIKRYVSFAADQRELDNIPTYPNPIYLENDSVVKSLSEVKNFLYLINPNKFTSKSDFINAVTATNYDLLIMDLFFNDSTEFTSTEIDRLKNKANGGKRLVIAYMSIGEAEDYRYYWQSDWKINKPSWLDAENPEWKGNYKVKYWDKEWQNIIFGNDSSYLKKILNADFDGVYLDIIDAYEYFE